MTPPARVLPFPPPDPPAVEAEKQPSHGLSLSLTFRLPAIVEAWRKALEKQ